MFKSWATWLGVENKKGQESETTVEVEEDEDGEVNKQREEDARLHTAKGFGYVYDFASSASKKLSESVVETAQSLKKSVEERSIDGIIHKTILGEFQKEQEKFVQEKKAKASGFAVPPWVGYNEEAAIQQQILALSADKRHFLRDPPAGVQFHFDFERMHPVAMVMLEEDELLRQMRFQLVPKRMKEEAFWKNYFYRVSLIERSAQVTALAARQAAERRREERAAPNRKLPPVSASQDKESEFASSKLNEDDVRRDMEQLVLDQRQQDETPDWERELQEELREYDVLADNENRDDNWEREIEEMLMEES
uniref:BSD domain-containing protein n=1 Tax=Gasterosteus aculeatus aculeatus TaxID=481459 RepID=G3PLM4_GASAC